MTYGYEKYPCSRFWKVYISLSGGQKKMVCLTVYKKGAKEVCRLLNQYHKWGTEVCNV